MSTHTSDNEIRIERGTLLPNVGLDGCIVVYGLK